MRCLFQFKIPDKFFLKRVRNAEKYEKNLIFPEIHERIALMPQGIICPLFQSILFFATLLW